MSWKIALAFAIFFVTIFLTKYVIKVLRDEEGAGWIIYKDRQKTLTGWSYEIKLGRSCWWKAGVTFGVQWAYPTWHGGKALGYAGI